MQANKKKRNAFVNQLHLALDVVLVSISFILSDTILGFFSPNGLSSFYPESYYFALLLQIIVSLLVSENIFKQYEDFTSKSFPRIILDNVKVLATLIALVILTNYVLKIDISRFLLGIFFVSGFFILFISKSILFFLYKSHYSKERNKHNVLIVGTRERARQAIEHIRNNKKHYRIIGCVDADTGMTKANGIDVIGCIADMKNIVLDKIVDEVMFAMPLKEIDSIDTIILFLETVGIQVRIFPDWYIHSTVFKPGISKMHFDEFKGSPTIVLTATNQNHLSLLFKNATDILAAFVLLILLSPLLVITAALIKSFSKGPALFKQVRMGRNGRTFTLYKFRSMVLDAEERLKELRNLNESDGPAFKIADDPRIIPVIGKFIRKTSIDELPQLINILKGDMSLVGPRPPLPAEVEKYDVWQRRRLSMKPGLTCIWQIQPGRNDLSFKEWMELDLAYIDTWSLGLDVSILFRTALVVFGAQGR